MENRETINNIDQIKEALDLAIQIQNEGIGTVFFRFDGHVNNVDVDIHTPAWVANASPDFSYGLCGDGDKNRKGNQESIASLKELLAKGKSGEDEVVLIEGKERAIRRQLYEELKREFEQEKAPVSQ